MKWKHIQVSDFLWEGISELDINYMLFPLIKNWPNTEYVKMKSGNSLLYFWNIDNQNVREINKQETVMGKPNPCY